MFIKTHKSFTIESSRTVKSSRTGSIRRLDLANFYLCHIFSAHFGTKKKKRLPRVSLTSEISTHRSTLMNIGICEHILHFYINLLNRSEHSHRTVYYPEQLKY